MAELFAFDEETMYFWWNIKKCRSIVGSGRSFCIGGVFCYSVRLGSVLGMWNATRFGPRFVPKLSIRFMSSVCVYFSNIYKRCYRQLAHNYVNRSVSQQQIWYHYVITACYWKHTVQTNSLFFLNSLFLERIFDFVQKEWNWCFYFWSYQELKIRIFLWHAQSKILKFELCWKRVKKLKLPGTGL